MPLALPPALVKHLFLTTFPYVYNRVAVLLCFTLICFALPCYWSKIRSSKTAKSKLCFAFFALLWLFENATLLCFARLFWANMP